MTYRVTYLKGKTAKGSDGKPYQQHEWHIDDFQRWCSGVNQNYQSEGFGSGPECEAGRRYFLMDTRALFDMAKTGTEAKLDKKK